MNMYERYVVFMAMKIQVVVFWVVMRVVTLILFSTHARTHLT